MKDTKGTPMSGEVVHSGSEKVLLDQSANKLLDDFGSGKAAPGSGSAAALMGILSGKLVTTVCSLSLDKAQNERKVADEGKQAVDSARYVPYENEYKYVKEDISQSIEPKLKRLFEDDAKRFEEVVRLRKEAIRVGLLGDKNAKSELDSKSKDILEEVTQFVFEMAEQSFKLISHGNFVFDRGYSAVRGDSGAAISAAIAAVTSCIFIINLNLKVLSRRKFAKEKKLECDDLYARLQRVQYQSFTRVGALGSEALKSIQDSF